MRTKTAAPKDPVDQAPDILQIALSLMAQRGVDGTSMRDLASAAGLNVASLYHYFPSKRELLEAVLVEHGFYPVRAPPVHPTTDPPTTTKLAALLTDILTSMFEVEDFVRLMVGEAMRGEETARTVGVDLFTTFEASIEDWIRKTPARPRRAIRGRRGGAAVDRDGGRDLRAARRRCHRVDGEELDP